MRQLKKTADVVGIEVTPSDLNDLRNGKLWDKATNRTPQQARDGFNETFGSQFYRGWAKDPDGLASLELLEKRFRGDFDWAMAELNKGSTDVIGNVESLNELELHDRQLVGEEINWDAYERGDCRCLGEWRINPVENGERVLKIAVGIGANCMASPEEVVRMATPAFAIAKAYAEAGYGVEMIAFSAVKGGIGNGGKAGVVAINCGEATISQAVSMLASALVFRSTVLRMQDYIEGWRHEFGYGSPIDHKQTRHSMATISNYLHDNYGDDLIVVHSGANTEQIKAALAMNTRRTTK